MGYLIISPNYLTLSYEIIWKSNGELIIVKTEQDSPDYIDDLKILFILF